MFWAVFFLLLNTETHCTRHAATTVPALSELLRLVNPGSSGLRLATGLDTSANEITKIAIPRAFSDEWLMLIAACDQYLQQEQRHEDEHKHNMQYQVRRQMTGCPQTSKSLTHAANHFRDIANARAFVQTSEINSPPSDLLGLTSFVELT